MALAVRPALDDLLAALRAAGFPGSHYDPELVNPPAAVWVQPRALRDLTLTGGATLVVWLYLLTEQADDDGVAGDLAKLDDALTGVLELLDALELSLSDDDGDAVDIAAAVLLPGRAMPLPAYRLAVELELEN
jgi:hypothetical protein